MTTLLLSFLATVAGWTLADPPGEAPSTSPQVPGPRAPEGTPSPEQPATPAPGTSLRVGGDMTAQVEKLAGGFYRFGTAAITTELPTGYPDPTPPGSIDVKTYPSVRRAEVSGSMSPDLGMNFGFFPLFNHIKRRSIAMTSPVEIDYKQIQWNPPEGGGIAPEAWTMSFLYRTSDLGPTGQDEKDKRIRIVDTPVVTVLSQGRRGPYRFTDARKQMEELDRWLETNPQWEKAGEPRVLYYNGPEKRERDKWSEVQWPIKLKVSQQAPSSPTSTEPADKDAPVGTAR